MSELGTLSLTCLLERFVRRHLGVNPPTVQLSVQIVLAIPKDRDRKLSMIVNGNPKLPHLAKRAVTIRSIRDENRQQRIRSSHPFYSRLAQPVEIAAFLICEYFEARRFTSTEAHRAPLDLDFSGISQVRPRFRREASLQRKFRLVCEGAHRGSGANDRDQ